MSELETKNENFTNVIDSIVKKMESVNIRMDMSEVIEKVSEVFDKYKDDPLVEIEGRLGIYEEDSRTFGTNIGDEHYENIKKLMMSGNKWKNTKETLETDYISKKLRLSVSDNGEQRCIEKKRLLNINFIIDNGPIDFRVSVSKEIPVDTDKFPLKSKCEHSRTKKRNTWEYKMWDFDLTEVRTNKKDSEEISYEFEIELRKNRNTIQDSKYLSESLILKMFDVIGTCGTLSESCKIRIVD
jgi:hypothetical protein